jgi:hypothetical protein
MEIVHVISNPKIGNKYRKVQGIPKTTSKKDRKKLMQHTIQKIYKPFIKEAGQILCFRQKPLPRKNEIITSLSSCPNSRIPHQ